MTFMTRKEEKSSSEHIPPADTAVRRVLCSESLVKRYKKRVVVNDVSIDVRQGEIVGLLGTERSRQNDDVLYDRRNDSPERRKSVP